MDTIRMKINGFEFPIRSDATILEASREAYGAKQWDIYIPTLQYLKGVQEVDDSGVCLVEVAGNDELVNASTTKVSAGMEVLTRSEKVMQQQTLVVNKILETHEQDCAQCFRTGNCELQELVRRQMVVTDPEHRKKKIHEIDKSGIVVRDENKCILCGRCVAACEKIEGICAIRKEAGRIVPTSGTKLEDTKCVSCGQCIAACPVGALRERNDVDAVQDALNDPEKFVVFQAAPSLRAGIGEAFELPAVRHGSDIVNRNSRICCHMFPPVNLRSRCLAPLPKTIWLSGKA